MKNGKLQIMSHKVLYSFDWGGKISLLQSEQDIFTLSKFHISGNERNNGVHSVNSHQILYPLTRSRQKVANCNRTFALTKL